MEKSKIKIISLFFLCIIAIVALNTLDQSFRDEKRPNIVMISLDTLRADHMQCFDYDKNVSPFICKYGQENIVFESTYSQAPWTLPSQTSTFTSKYPSVHNTTTNNRKVGNDSKTLAEVLNRNGYNTAAFVNGNLTKDGESKSTGHYLPKYGLDKGFSDYHVEDIYINDTFSSGLNWLNNQEGDKPFFLFLQGYDIHQYGTNKTQNKFRENVTGFFRNQFSPFEIENKSGNWVYSPDWSNTSKNLSGEELNQLNDIYNANIYRTDKDLERLFERLKEKGEYDNTIVVIYSAHGTNLNDRVVDNKITGHISLRDFNLHVPLIMRIPGEKSMRISEKVELIDVMPTLLALSSSETEETLQGENLKNLIQGSSDGKKYVYSEYGEKDSIRSEEWRLIRYASGKTTLIDSSTGNTITDQAINKTVNKRLLEKLQQWKINNLKHN